MKRIFTALLAALFTQAPAQEAPRVVNISPQSVEFFFPATDTEKVLCTVRLHITPSEGYSIRQNTPPQELSATDAAGNNMKGNFREWEHCYDADEEKRCIIAVYDFPTRPQGGSMSCDTMLSIPLSCGEIEHAPTTFHPGSEEKLTINGHEFSLTPSSANDEDPDNTAFILEYENAPDIAAITICDKEGVPLESNIIEGACLENSNRVSATYVLSSKHEELQFRLSTHKPQGEAFASVKFQARIGR